MITSATHSFSDSPQVWQHKYIWLYACNSILASSQRQFTQDGLLYSTLKWKLHSFHHFNERVILFALLRLKYSTMMTPHVVMESVMTVGFCLVSWHDLVDPRRPVMFCFDLDVLFEISPKITQMFEPSLFILGFFLCRHVSFTEFILGHSPDMCQDLARDLSVGIFDIKDLTVTW